MLSRRIKMLVAMIFSLTLIGSVGFVLAEDDENHDYEGEGFFQPAPVTPTVTPVSTSVKTVGASSLLVDSDGDGIIDSLDMYVGDDDFAFAVRDVNRNGLADDLEYLLSK